jgi:hypothetical protein
MNSKTAPVLTLLLVSLFGVNCTKKPSDEDRLQTLLESYVGKTAGELLQGLRVPDGDFAVVEEPPGKISAVDFEVPMSRARVRCRAWLVDQGPASRGGPIWSDSVALSHEVGGVEIVREAQRLMVDLPTQNRRRVMLRREFPDLATNSW